jgi:hypothetical protein
MTLITRIDADLLFFIRDDPRYQRYPRSIDAFFAASTNWWTVYAIDNQSNEAPCELFTGASNAVTGREQTTRATPVYRKTTTQARTNNRFIISLPGR